MACNVATWLLGNAKVIWCDILDQGVEVAGQGVGLGEIAVGGTGDVSADDAGGEHVAGERLPDAPGEQPAGKGESVKEVGQFVGGQPEADFEVLVRAECWGG